jgi:hypothetical protein
MGQSGGKMDEKTTVKTTVVEQKESKDNAADERWAKAEHMLAEIKPGWSLSIHRIRPGWCSGYLERIECTEDEPLDLDYIISTWGGEVLKLRLCDDMGKYHRGAQLNLRSYPPRFKGQRLHQNPEDEPRGKTQMDPVQMHNPPPPQLDLVGVLSLLQKTRKEDLGLLRALLGSTPQVTAQQPIKPSNSLDDILAFAGKWKQLQAVFGAEQAQPVNDDAGFMGSITEIVKALGQMGQKPPAQQQQPQQAGRIIPPQNDRQPNPDTIEGTNVHPNGAHNQLSDVISQLDSDKFSDIVLTALAKMPDDIRERTIQTFFERSGLLEDREPDDPDDDDSDEEYDIPNHRPTTA